MQLSLVPKESEADLSRYIDFADDVSDTHFALEGRFQQTIGLSRANQRQSLSVLFREDSTMTRS